MIGDVLLEAPVRIEGHDDVDLPFVQRVTDAVEWDYAVVLQLQHVLCFLADYFYRNVVCCDFEGEYFDSNLLINIDCKKYLHIRSELDT